MNARRLTVATLTSLCALLGAALSCSAPALAAREHIFVGAFAQPGSGNGQLTEPSGVAVNDTTHNVYVVDKGNNRVEEFSSTGAYIGQFDGSGTLPGEGSAAPTGRFSAPESIAVDNSGNPLSDPSAGDVYVTDNGHDVIDKFSSTGSYIGQLTAGSPGSAFRSLYGVAVDQNGMLWADVPLDGNQVTIDNFNDAISNEFLSENEVQFAELSFPNGLAVDSEDNLYVGRFGNGHTAVVAKLTSTVSIINEEIDPNEPTTAVAVDPSTNDPYLDNVSSVGRYSSAGKLVERLGAGILREGAGVAIDPSTEEVYVADSSADAVDIFEIEPYSPPVVESAWVSDVSSTSATLSAQVNPRGSSTEYRFEYGPSTSYGSSAPVPDGSIAAGFGASTVSTHRAGLLAQTTYHYRVVAHNELGTILGADHTFTTQPGAGEAFALPDERAWELVSPPDKHGAVIEPFYSISGIIQAADDGNAITYPSEGPAVGENPKSRSIVSTTLSRRIPGGWGSTDIDAPRRTVNEGESTFGLALGASGEIPMFSPDLSLALTEPTGDATPPLSPQATERTLYLRDNATESYLPLVTPADVSPGAKFGGEGSEGSALHESKLEMRFVAATPDLSHVVFESPLALIPPAVSVLSAERDFTNGLSNLYEWAGGQLQLVNILPDGEPTHTANNFDGPNIVGESDQGGYGLAARPISADGRWIAWTWGDSYHSAENYQGLYVRDMVAKKTFAVGGPSARYQTMSSDGERIFFIEDGELYEFDTDTATQHDLTAHHDLGEGSAGVRELVTDVSDDGSYVYFVSNGVLADGALSGADNLYLLHESGGEWDTAYIATLSPEDEASWYAEEFGGGPNLAGVSSRVSPDGRYLAFMSNRSLTGYDNLDANSGQPDEEVYLYDAASQRLVCASCDPTGARPVGVLDSSSSRLLVDNNEYWGYSGPGRSRSHWLAGSLPGWAARNNGQSLYQPRYLSDSGRLFFNSPDALVPQDTNNLEDVYQYEPSGVGSCLPEAPSFSERTGGCVSPISSGTSSSESVFYDASEDGNDVFFLTSSRLTPADYDTSADVYDAHVCSAALPCQAAPVSPPPCSSGDSCKAAPSPQPAIFGAPASATFNGAGNVVPANKIASVSPKCKKGVAKKHDRCVRKRKSEKKHRAKRTRNHRRAKR